MTWEMVAVRDTIQRKPARVGKVPRSRYQSTGRFPIIDQGQGLVAGYWDDEADAYMGPLPVIIFGDHTRAVKFVDFPFVCGADGTKVLQPSADQFDPEFLYFALSWLDVPSRGYNRHFRILSDMLVPRPPLAEQRAIARVLRAVHRSRQATEVVEIAAAEVLRGLAEELLERRRLDLPKMDPDAQWPLVDLANVVEDDSPICYGILKPGPDKEEGVPYVRVADYPEGRVNLAGVRRTTQEIAHQYRRSKLRTGDILVSIRGTTGRIARVPVELEGANITQDTARVSPSARFDRDFLVFFLRSRKAQEYIRAWTRGAAVKGINLRELRLLPVPAPSVSEQQTLSRRLTAAERKVKAEAQRRLALGQTFNSLLSGFMSGRVRVPIPYQA